MIALNENNYGKKYGKMENPKPLDSILYPLHNLGKRQYLEHENPFLLCRPIPLSKGNLALTSTKRIE